MASLREQILQAARAALLNQTPAADRVYRSRVQMLERDELPAIVVKAGEEESEKFRSSFVRKKLEIRLELHGAGDPADELLDPVLVAAHAALMADAGLANLLFSLEERSIGEPEFDDADDGSAKIVMTYQADYLTQPKAIDAPA